MQLMVISSPVAVAGEAARLNQLFAAGLEVLHLRKPGASSAELVALLHQLDPVYYSRIALHQHHALAEPYGITRLHFPEKERPGLTIAAGQKMQAAGYQLSTSVHQPEMLKKLLPVFKYAFLSPVFTSISKPNYKPIINADYYLQAAAKPLPVIALGGINHLNINQLKKMNFSGAALLGAIWQEPEHALKNFKVIQHACSQIALTC